jgi:hypothetical protein
MNILYKLFILFVIFNGLSLAIIKLLSLNIHASIFSYLALVTLFIIIINSLFKIPIKNYEKSIIFFGSFILIGILLKMNFKESLTLQSIYIWISYYVIPFLTFLSLRAINNYDKIIYFISKVGFYVVIFAYLQLLFPAYLPIEFRLIPEAENTIIGAIRFQDFIFNTPNGLIGNAMIFGTFLIILFTLYLKQYFDDKSIWNICKVILTWILIFFLFSRAAFLGSIIIFGIYMFTYTSKKKIFFYSLFIFIFSLFIIMILYENNQFVQYMINRIILIDENAIQSTNIHINEYIKVFDILENYPFLGIQLSSDFDSRIITDGTWFQNLLDMGILLFGIYLLFWIYLFYFILRRYFKRKKENNISVIALSLIIYIGLANFLNSSYLAKTNSILFMIMIGILFYSYHKTLENSRGNL